MSTVTLDEKHFKKLVKETLLELFEERRDVFSAIVVEALEELGLAHAIRDGRREEYVREEEVQSILGG
jgi:hypothetical protein